MFFFFKYYKRDSELSIFRYCFMFFAVSYSTCNSVNRGSEGFLHSFRCGGEGVPQPSLNQKVSSGWKKKLFFRSRASEAS